MVKNCSVSGTEDIEVIFGSLVVLGILGSFLPQHWNLLRLKSSRGLTLWYPLVASLGALCSVINAVFDQFGRIQCCERISTRLCYISLLGLYQIGIQFLSLFLIFVLFVLYHEGRGEGSESCIRARWSLAVYGVIMLLLVDASILLIYYQGADSHTANVFADVMSILAAVCMTVQLVPQIVTTFRLKRTGSLSVPMLCLQTPGAVVWIVDQAFINKESVWTWLPYVAHATGLFFLLLLSIRYDFPVWKAWIAGNGISIRSLASLCGSENVLEEYRDAGTDTTKTLSQADSYTRLGDDDTRSHRIEGGREEGTSSVLSIQGERVT